MLWNIIRDFFVQNFFGGYLTSGGAVYCKFASGRFLDVPSNQLYTIDVPVSIGDNYFICVGDWLSTTFTVITFILIFLALFAFIKWVFRFFSHSFLLR